MRLPYLRFNLHHLCLAVCVLIGVATWFYHWPLLFPALAIMALVLLVADAIARPGSSLFYPTVSHGPRGDKRVALSFDDGPDPETTAAVLDLLKEYRVRATFFVIGRALEAHPALGRRMAAEGHAIGNHSWQHSRWQNFWFTARLEREIVRGQQAIATVTGIAAPCYYRPPVGLKSGELGHAAWKCGLTLVAWSLHSRDTRLADAESIARRVLDRVQGGDIVLMHDGHDLPGRKRPLCAPALRLILAGLRERGLECVTVPELLAARRETA